VEALRVVQKEKENDVLLKLAEFVWRLFDAAE
jgi:hypothetical protein